jgi:hypothetical protein
VGHALGTWENVYPETGEIASVEISRHADRLVLRAFGMDDGTRLDWGEIEIAPHASGPKSAELAGFQGLFDFGFLQVRLAANIKLGVLVIQSYNTYLDGSGRPNYYRREFFARTNDGQGARPDLAWGDSEFQAGLSGPPEVGGGPLSTTVADLSRLVGNWHNTNAATRWLRSFTLSHEGGSFVLHATGARDPHDWGKRVVTGYRDNIGELAFHVAFQLSHHEAILAANTNKGLIVVAGFYRFEAGRPASDFLCREFFHRPSG